jgi:hypothetical protein
VFLSPPQAARAAAAANNAAVAEMRRRFASKDRSGFAIGFPVGVSVHATWGVELTFRAPGEGQQGLSEQGSLFQGVQALFAQQRPHESIELVGVHQAQNTLIPCGRK